MRLLRLRKEMSEFCMWKECKYLMARKQIVVTLKHVFKKWVCLVSFDLGCPLLDCTSQTCKPYTWLPWWLSGKEPAWQCRRHRSDPWATKIPLEKEMATYSSILAWKLLWTEDPGGLQSMGSQRVGHDLATKQQQQQKDKYCVVILIENI